MFDLCFFCANLLCSIVLVRPSFLFSSPASTLLLAKMSTLNLSWIDAMWLLIEFAFVTFFVHVARSFGVTSNPVCTRDAC